MVPRTPSPLDMMEDVMQSVFDDKDTVMMPSPLLLLAAVILVFGVSSAALAFRCLLIILILIHSCVMGDDCTAYVKSTIGRLPTVSIPPLIGGARVPDNK
jgi:hypothetical protein